MIRRTLLLAAGAAALVAVVPDAFAGPRQKRRVKRRVRRRIRRRHRRRVARRIVAGRSFWVVPVAVAIGWELQDGDRVVVVRETRFVERDGAQVEVLVVVDAAGAASEVEVIREDSAENMKELEGSVLADGDTAPGVDSEIEEEIEVEE